MIRSSTNTLICLWFCLLPVVTNNVMTVPSQVQNFTANDEIGFRIKNGLLASVGQFPYQISFKVKSIIRNYRSFCGGAILSTNKILSAGHCFTHTGNSCDRACKKVKTKNINDMYAVAGTLNNRGPYKDDSAGTEQWRKLRLMLLPPGYYYMTNDISLVFVHGKFVFNAQVSPLPAATMPKDYGSITCKMSGYGRINDIEESLSTINDEESLDENVDDRQSTTATEDDTPSMRQPPPTVRRRNKHMELEAAGETVKDALVTLKETMNSRRIQEDDECDLHGKVIAKKLRKLPENERMEFVCDIYNLFLRHEQRTPASLSPYLASPTPSPPYSYNRTQKHFSQNRECSEPTTPNYQRAHSSQSSYSDPPMQYYLSPPVIHIPEETPAPADSQIIVTSNRCIQPATPQPPNDVPNLIDVAFKNA